MHTLSSFHDYDIRGIVGSELDEEFYYLLGAACAAHFKTGPIGVGHDMRTSSPSLSNALIQGIVDHGVSVVDLGLISTEIHYYAAGTYQYPANIIVSASHNPPQYNGAKIVQKGVVPLHGNFGLDKLKELMEKNTFVKAQVKGEIQKKDIFNEWIEHALTFVDKSALKKLKVVVDAGNGMGGPSWKAMIEKLPEIEIIPLYLEPDGTFPHHLADPLKIENTLDLKKAIVEHKADLGIALDGDADRIFFMDERAEMISGTVTTAILAELFLKKKKGTILYNAICGRVVKETIEKLGGTAVRTRVGHSFIKETMKETDALFGGEHSGHFYIGNNFNAESSLITGLIMIEMLSRKGISASALAQSFDIYPQSGEINFLAENKDEITKKIEEAAIADGAKVDHLDGLSVWHDSYWYNVRASKTEKLLRLNIEADTVDMLNEKKEHLINSLVALGATQK